VVTCTSYCSFTMVALVSHISVHYVVRKHTSLLCVQSGLQRRLHLLSELVNSFGPQMSRVKVFNALAVRLFYMEDKSEKSD
jgi:hypothetical protein